MPRILVLETDPVFAAVLEDRLHVAGYRTTMVANPAALLAGTEHESPDLVILEAEIPEGSGLDVVRGLRQRPATRSLPIVVLGEGTGAERLTALRAGADEYLTRPFDVEELLLRLERLLGTRGLAPPVMQGDLENHPPWELLQYIQNGAKSGELSISGREGSGKVGLWRGKVVEARFQQLRGREALIAFLGLKQGRFRLADDEEKNPGEPPEDAISLQEVLMEAVWLEDELRHRQAQVPATGAPLEARADQPGRVATDFAHLPLERVLRVVRARPGIRLFDLLADSPEAPQKVRLAAALLAEQGVLAARARAADSPVLTTMEISSSLVLDLAITNLLEAAKSAGFDTAALPYLLLAEPGVWPELEALMQGVPGAEPLRKLGEALKLRRGGSAMFETTELGKLSLHVQMLSEGVKTQVEGIASVCAGVLVWLDRGGERAVVEQVMKRIEASRGAVGALVAETPEARQVAEDLRRRYPRWQVSAHAPRALVGVLRLLHPRTGGS